MSERKLFLSLVLTVGVIGNVLVILVLISYKSMRTSTNLFLLNLRCFLGIRENQLSEICSSSWSISSIADLLVLIICCPNAMVEMYMRRVRWKLLFFSKTDFSPTTYAFFKTDFSNSLIQDIWVMGEAMCKLVPFIGKNFFGVQLFIFCPLLSPRAYCVAYVRPNYTCHHCRKILRGRVS